MINYSENKKVPLKYDKKALEEVCCKFELGLVVLHGSYVTGLSTPRSDIDIAILGENRIIRKKMGALISELSDVFGDKCDCVFLNSAETMITRNVALKGIPLYEKDAGLFNQFKTTAITRYQDAFKFRRLERDYVERKAKEAELS